MATDADARHIFAENLKRYLAASGKTQNDLVDYLGCSASTVSEWLAEKKYPRPGRMQKTADFFGVLMSDLLKEPNAAPNPTPVPPGFEPPPETYKVPLVGNIACGTPITAEENIEQMVDIPVQVKGCDFALHCKGTSMIDAGIRDGDLVCIHKQPMVENGEIAAVRIGEEATLKRVYYDGDSITLMAANPAVPPKTYYGEALNDIVIEGKAISYTHWL